MAYKLPPVGTIHTLQKHEQDDLLNNLFEPHASIVAYLSPVFSTSYSSYEDLIDAAHALFKQLDPQSDLMKDIISSHPRLGLPKTAELSEHSSQEQRSLQGDEVVSEFTQLNKDYEAAYPGLRFVVFVNGRDRATVKQFFKERINRGDYNLEVQDAIQAMCDIAKDRAGKLESKL